VLLSARTFETAPLHQKAKAERDTVAEELARVYPAIARQLAGVVTRLLANGKQLDMDQQSRPPLGQTASARPKRPRVWDAALEDG
jgi:hypothetical protein